MASDYRAIHREHETRYGTGVGEYGDKLLPHRYGDRTHFIYELLQNAEDALARRRGWNGPRSIQFRISPRELRVRHFGLPFDEADVRGICGIGESTKDAGLTEIGRFGIGFKSVYAFTDRPEVHSGPEDFAIEHYVLPAAAPAVPGRGAEETLFVFPLRRLADAQEIGEAVRRLAPRALLFLREIEEIEWRIEDGASGLYLRETQAVGDGVRRVTLVGEADGQRETRHTWLVFARTLPAAPGAVPRHVEVAFRLGEEDRLAPVPERDTPLFAFFPTTLRTGLRFRVQGPFRTTLGRDNVPAGDRWNEGLVRETAGVLGGALRWLRDHQRLDAEALRCLPFHRDRFPDGSLLAPLREAVSRALRAEPLLPRRAGGFVAGGGARLASPKWLGELLDPEQLQALFPEVGGAGWLTPDVPLARTDALSRALQDGAGVRVLRLDSVLRRLDTAFLEAQPDAWVRRLYEVFGEHRVLGRRVAGIPLVRLRDGAHVPPVVVGRPGAFLPDPTGEAAPEVPVVRDAVVESGPARKYLRDLGLEELDPLELAMRRVLPRYRSGQDAPAPRDYARDLRDLVRAHRAGSPSGRRRLERELRQLAFVRTVHARSGEAHLSRPGDACLATGEQRELFAGLPAVRFVDDGGPALGEEGARNLLRACGVRPLLEPFAEKPDLTAADRMEIRSSAPGADPEGGIACIEEWNLRGLDALLTGVARMPAQEQERRRELLLRELERLRDVHDLAVRSGKYECDAADGNPVPVQAPAAWMRRLTSSDWAPEARPLLHIGLREPARGPTGTAPTGRGAAGRAAPRKPGGGPAVPIRPGVADGAREPPDKTERERRLGVEAKAIALILERERWRRAGEDNPGFDLFREDAVGRPTLLCEVKGLSGSLDDHPARLTPNELRHALEHGENYWLYIVENVAGDSPNILRIRDPAGAVARFDFGPEWRGRTEPPP